MNDSKFFLDKSSNCQSPPAVRGQHSTAGHHHLCWPLPSVPGGGDDEQQVEGDPDQREGQDDLQDGPLLQVQPLLERGGPSQGGGTGRHELETFHERHPRVDLSGEDKETFVQPTTKKIVARVRLRQEMLVCLCLSVAG